LQHSSIQASDQADVDGLIEETIAQLSSFHPHAAAGAPSVAGEWAPFCGLLSTRPKRMAKT
jgi:hypothetical protein